MPFVKGKSGNPSGRKKVPEELKQMFEAAAPNAVQFLIRLIDGSEEGRPSDRVRAAEIILDRHLGKPLQAVQHEGDVGGAVILLAPDQIFDNKAWEAAAQSLEELQ